MNELTEKLESIERQIDKVLTIIDSQDEHFTCESLTEYRYKYLDLLYLEYKRVETENTTP